MAMGPQTTCGSIAWKINENNLYLQIGELSIYTTFCLKRGFPRRTVYHSEEFSGGTYRNPRNLTKTADLLMRVMSHEKQMD